MAEPAGRIPRPRLEVPLIDGRMRFVRLARLAALVQRSRVVTDAGRPLAAIVPISGVTDSAAVSGRSTAGWLRRFETVRAEFHRQHALIVSALELAWQEIDRVSPPGVDSRIDVLRLAHADLRRPR